MALTSFWTAHSACIPTASPAVGARHAAALAAGWPSQLTGGEVYTALCADAHLARTCRDLMDDQSVYEVRADTLDKIGT